MSLIIDQNDINRACEWFGIDVQDYYLGYTSGVVYLYWTATLDEVNAMKERDQQCVDIHSKDKWLDLLNLGADKMPRSRYVLCRYILAVN